MLKSEFELIIPQFEDWLSKKGYKTYPITGQYEIMRFKNNNSPMNIIFFNKDGHITKMTGDAELLFDEFNNKPKEFEFKKIKFTHTKIKYPLSNQMIIKTQNIDLVECYEIVRYDGRDEDFYWGVIC